MYEFNYKSAKNLLEAKALLGSSDDPKLMAGGQTLIPTLKQRLAMPSDVIDIGKLDELHGIEMVGDRVSIGAGQTHASVHTSSLVQEKIPALAELAGEIGDPHVRHRGTLGGSISNNDPAADYPAAVVALNGTVVTTEREISAEDFFTGMFETALSEDEIVKCVQFSVPETAAYMKFPNPASRYAMAGVFVAKHGGDVCVAVTGAGSCVFRIEAMEKALSANFAVDALAGIDVPADDLISDLHGSAAYRANLVAVMAKRAVAACA